MNERKRDTRRRGQKLAPCLDKTCPGAIREQWRDPEWIEGKCDTCGAQVGYPMVFSIPAQKGARR